MNVALYTISLCAGTGMLDEGLAIGSGEAFEPVLYVEREAYAAALLARRMEEGVLAQEPIWSDARTVATGAPGRDPYARDIQVKAYLYFRCGDRGPEALVGGIPCQPHSAAGKKAGADDERDLWPACLDILGSYPSIAVVFIENVPGMLTTGGAFRVVNDLDRLGFTTAADLVTAEETGASHRRERLFVLGIKVADGDCHKQRTDARQTNARPDRRDDIARSGAELGHAQGVPRGQGRPEHEGLGGAPATMRAGGAVADASIDNGRRRERGAQEGPWKDGIGRRRSPERGLGLYAPGPKDLDAWRHVLEVDPTLEPALCQLPDGLASKMDVRSHELRAGGNGVVAASAALAFARMASAILRHGREW